LHPDACSGAQRASQQSALPDTSGSKNSIQAIGSTTHTCTLHAIRSDRPCAEDADTDGAEPHVLAESIKLKYWRTSRRLRTRSVGGHLENHRGGVSSCGDIPSYDELKKAAAKKLKSLRNGERNMSAILEEGEQRGVDWLMQRVGHATGSRFAASWTESSRASREPTARSIFGS